MIKKLIPLLIILGVITIKTYGEWIPITKDKTDHTPRSPKVTIVSDDESGTLIKIDISGFELNSVTTTRKTYHTVDLLTDVITNKEGYPEVSYISKLLAIPDEAGISYEVVKTGETYTFGNIYLKPAQRSWFEGMPESVIEEDTQAYYSRNTFPESSVFIESPVIFRDFRIARVCFYPIRYNPSKKELEVVSSMTVRINYGKGKSENIRTTEKREIAPSFGTIYRSMLLNYQSVLDREYGGKEAGHDLMLCIMPDVFVASFTPYAEWKRKSGIDIKITKFSDIGATSSNPVTIKNHITTAYHNWEVPPTYVLIIGDDGVFPKKIVNYDYSFPNEDFFVEIDGDDYFPEMMIGRFTNQEDYRMRVMINKFQLYETSPLISDPQWFKKGVCCSNNYYDTQVETKRFTAEVMMEDGNFISVDTLMSDGDPYGGQPCTMDNSDVISVINNGRSHLNYRGEGWSSGWWATCTPLQTEDLSQINNGQKFPFVTSIGCGVAMFDTGGGNCFGEEWVEMGTLTSPRGAVAFVGPTSNTHTTYNNKIDKGIYVGMFREAMDTPGQALLRGKLYMYNVYGGSDPWVEYHYRIYCVLGDPSIHIWKDLPLDVVVDYEVSDGILEVQINHELSGLPVDSAQVTITGETFFASNYTNETGITTIDISTYQNEELTLTVRGRTVYPHSEILDLQIGVPVNQKEISHLNQNVPNPFNKNTAIEFSVSKYAHITLEIFDIRGQLIHTIQNGYLPQGNYLKEWNGTDTGGNQVPSGIYYYCLKTGDSRVTKKMVKL